MKILVTGTEGYLGSLLPPLLIERGHEVIGVDTGFYKVGWLYNGTEVTAKTLNKDIRNITSKDLQDIEAVVHMAELSNDPTGQLSPNITYDINHHGSVRLAKLAKEAGVRRFVYMSSCSVYGVATEGDVTEESSVNPQTAYAECKTLVEKDVTLLADDNFSPTFMRNATAFGASPRMRFDIVLNNLAALVVATLLFTAMFKVLPDAKMAWRDMWIGGMVTAVLFVIGKALIGVYVKNSDLGSSWGTAAASLIGVLVWMYFSSFIVLFGAEFTQVWASEHGRGIQPAEGAVPAEPADAEPRPGKGARSTA